jgi:hypothetical protein
MKYVKFYLKNKVASFVTKNRTNYEPDIRELAADIQQKTS